MLSPFSAGMSAGPHRLPTTASPAGPKTTSLAAGMSPAEQRRRPAARFGQTPSPLSFQNHAPPDSSESEQEEDDPGQDDGGSEGEDGPDVQSPLLPIFSAEHLDSLPIYNITLLIRVMICKRCETTLTWDQLRTPQVSQFLIKPIQQQIRDSHFSKATLYALLCAFIKGELSAIQQGSADKSRQQWSQQDSSFCKRASSNEAAQRLFHAGADALSYDFYPLQGLTSRDEPLGTNWTQRSRPPGRVARISTFEIAIKAQAKRFLAHPLVVEQLQAIWKGNVVFHHAADNFHRPPVKVVPNQNRGYKYGAIGESPALRASPLHLQPAKQRDHREPVEIAVRRSVTLYDPKQASLLKLSRLRVPRYRQFFSTCSFAILLALYVIVLYKRQVSICLLEVLFWLWSAGFLLDEIVGFNEQGFSLYIMSFWNAFDVVIFGLLLCFYLLRLYGITLPTLGEQKLVADISYDLLAANAVLLFPRLFSVLDHYRYFSQLLIAFRMMAIDLIAVLILVLVSCSGFFVAFTLSFGEANDYNAGAVAYTLFQILMGFTPAAWDVWGDYNLLGRMILTLFLFICHFLIVTILITVLTNSFMSIVISADTEHSFLFAVNTISMVRSDALFSYLAPTNILSWIIAPSRFCISFQAFVRINRNIIKATHFPMLFGIYLYEKFLLQRTTFEATDLLESRGRQKTDVTVPGRRLNGLNVFRGHANSVREPSVATFHKDKALEQVFRGPLPDGAADDTPRNRRRRETSNVVSHWMSEMGPEPISHPPMEQDRDILERLEARRPVHRRSMMALRKRQGGSTRDFTEATMSVASDPEDFLSRETFRAPTRVRRPLPFATPEKEEPPSQSADDELADDDDDDLVTLDQQTSRVHLADMVASTPPDKLTQQVQMADSSNLMTGSPRHSLAHTLSSSGSSSPSPRIASMASTPRRLPGKRPTPVRSRNHTRHPSTNTIIFDPQSLHVPSARSSPNGQSVQKSGRSFPVPSRNQSGRQTPKKSAKAVARPIMPPRTAFKSAPDLTGLLSLSTNQGAKRHPSLAALGIGSDIGDNKAIVNAAFPASFATEMDYANAGMRIRKQAMQQERAADVDRLSRLVLAKMNSLEAEFREMIREVQGMRKEGAARHEAGGSS